MLQYRLFLVRPADMIADYCRWRWHLQCRLLMVRFDQHRVVRAD